MANMERKMIRIDAARCDGCGLCAQACHEGAIAMVDGKAKLVREDHCDGLGDCLPACPTGAITFEVRQAPAYDPAAVARTQAAQAIPASCVCPGSQARTLSQPVAPCAVPASAPAASCLAQWPVQIKLAPLRAPYFDGAHLLIAADCTAYAYGAFHRDFMAGRVTLIGCPKLDEGDYRDKLTQLLLANDIRSVTVVRMEVPCCGGIQRAVQQAVAGSEKAIPLQVVVLSADGRILQGR